MAFISFIKHLFRCFGQDKAGQLSAALAYVAVFSIGMLLLLLVGVVTLVLGERAVQGQLYTQLADVVGPSTAETLQNLVIRSHQSGSGPSLWLGIAGILLGATALTAQLQSSLNTIFKIVPDPSLGWKRTIYTKAKNVLITLLGVAAVTVSLAISAVVNGVGERLHNLSNLPPAGLELINNLFSMIVFTLMLYLLYRVVPDVKIPRKIVLFTSVVVALMFLAGKIVLGVIIGRNGTAGAYGAAASLVTLLLWVYYSAQILFIGAEGMKVYGLEHGLAYRPKKHSLKRDTINIDHHGLPGWLTEAFARGYKKKSDN